MSHWKLINEHGNTRYAGDHYDCCAVVNQHGNSEFVVDAGTATRKWAVILRDKMKLPMTIGTKTITLQYYKYRKPLYLFAAWTMLRLALEHPKVITTYYEVVKEIPKIDPLHALYVALIWNKIKDSGRGLFWYRGWRFCYMNEQASTVKMLTVSEMHEKFKENRSFSVTGIFGVQKKITKAKARQIEESKTYTQMYKRLQKT